jgi:hypothetical protein
MVFDGNEGLHVAQYLGGMINGPCTLESVQRAAISRAYFAAYLHAFYCEIDSGRFERSPAGSGGIDHGRLVKHFRDIKEHKIATELKELHEWRKKCDYNYYMEPPRTMVTELENALINAKDIIDYIK